MKKLKQVLTIIIWPIIFIVGQIFIKYPFVAYFNSLEFQTLKKQFPNLTNNQLNEKLLDYQKDITYQDSLNKFINEKALIITLITFIIFGFIFYRIYKKYRKEKIQINIKNSYKLAIVGISISLFYNIFIYYLNNIVHITDNYYISDIPLIIQILTTGLMGPILEELLFRGIVFNRLRQMTSLNKSTLFTSILFALFHLPNVVNAIYAFILSFILIKVYLKYNTIKTPIIIHVFANITTCIYLPILLDNNLVISCILLIISILNIAFLQKIKINCKKGLQKF